MTRPRPAQNSARPVRRGTALAAATLGALALVLSACADSPAGRRAAQEEAGNGTAGASGDTREVTVVLDWTPNTNHSGLYLAQERGYFEDAGLDVTILEPGDITGLELLATGDAQFAFSVAESLVPAVAGGVDAVSIAAVIQENTSSLLASADSGIATPADLPGKVYGTWGSPLETALVETLVQCSGGDPNAIETAPMASEDVRIGLTQQQYDYVWVYDAWDTIRLRDVDGMDVTTIPFVEHQDCIPNWYTPLVATRQSTIDTDPELVQDFLGALAAGYGDAMREPQAAADAILAASPELDADLVGRSAEYLATRYAASPEEWGTQDAATWEGFIGFLADHELTGGDVDPASVWTGDPLQSARDAAGGTQ